MASPAFRRRFSPAFGLKHVAACALLALMTAAPSAIVFAADDVTPAEAPPAVSKAQDVLPTVSGAYLAARFAQQNQDWDNAYTYHDALVRHMPESPEFTQRAFLISVGTGNFTKAHNLANRLTEMKSESTELVTVYLAIEAIADAKYDDALKHIAALPDKSFGQFSKPLLSAWSHVGKGDAKTAVELLTRAQDGKEDPTFLFHSGLISAYVKDDAAARKYFERTISLGTNVQNILIIADYFANNGDPEFAKTLHEGLKALSGDMPNTIFIATARSDGATRLTADTPAAGAALALMEVAAVLNDRKFAESALIYARMAERMAPKSDSVAILLGDIFANQGRATDAAKAYESVAQTSPLYWLSRLKAVQAHELAGDSSRAIALVEDLSDDDRPYQKRALIYLGDLYRKQDKYSAAISAYTRALKDFKNDAANEENPETGSWAIYYARGMAYERDGNWTKAEADLTRAISLKSDNAHLLNYLAYSWVEKGINLDKAEEMLEQAVALKPNDGYILDSYGWLKFKQGSYAEAVTYLERAIEVDPYDMTINDHLGDAYAAVNRRNEASFQWQRALKAAETMQDRERIAAKLDPKLRAALLAPYQEGEAATSSPQQGE